ncbi:ribonucleotide-diphosphate reductase subunit alpha [Acidovorax sp. NO-1]|uniref:ribonucleotide-diphosphate reductase subunit alpha n=1 Tax=Acidovorax sp. NO-1 TaxID=512030 RepID=UPI00023FCD87|nr:ribonucleotide-diphosphate reductase subunit alpha [Acidovorax sp. NO-1]EHL24835.1 ribonucleotide-diphosphate reductase subunit alpha [Acidovorax sp. NO-1]
MHVCLNGPSGSSTTAHRAIIRRNGAVVPFEHQMIAVAMMKAFMAVWATSRAAPTRLSVTGLVSPLSSRVTQWRSHLLLHTYFFKMAGDARPSARRRDNTVLRDGAAAGFFSAAKPNLRNAP